MAEPRYPAPVPSTAEPAVGAGAETVAGGFVGVIGGEVVEEVGVGVLLCGVLVGVGVLVGEGGCAGKVVPPVGVAVGVRVGVRVGVAVQIGAGRVPSEFVGVGVRVGVGVEVDGGVVAVGSGVWLGSSVLVGVGPVADGPGVSVGPGVLVTVGGCVAPGSGVAVRVDAPTVLVDAASVAEVTGQGEGVAVGAATVAATRAATSSGERVSLEFATTNVDKALIVPERAVS